jgi:K+/H+ antiporter YhaU regulatory subunit KhtT
MTSRPVTVGPLTPVSQALERMAVLGVGRLPVVSEDDSTRLVGMFRREDAISAYHRALGQATGAHLDRARLKQRTDPGGVYFDFRVPPGSMAADTEVKAVNWCGCTLVSVRRGREVMVPGGETILRRGDVVTAFGTEPSRQRLITELNESADEPTAEIVLDDLLGHRPDDE